jgi:hypothetical protein
MSAELNAEQQRLGDDLAFLRALAEGGGESQRNTGAIALAAGLLYGLQCFVSAAQLYEVVLLGETFYTLFSAGITFVFLLVASWIGWKGRKASEGGVMARALNAAFAAAGTATLAMLCVFGSVALREESITIWMLYPCAVFALQGAAWMVAWRLRRRAWLGVVAAGWMLSAIALSATIGSPLYTLVAGAALVLFLAVPGAIMMRPPKA